MSAIPGRPGSRGALAAVLGAYLLLATAYSVVVPLGEAPDEVSHYSYARYVAREGRLPPAEGPASGEAFQPPLYYAVGAAISRWIPEGQFMIKGNADYSLAVMDSVPNVLLHTAQESFPYRDGALAWHLLRLLSVAMGAVTVWATYALSAMVFPKRQSLAVAAAAFIGLLPEFLFISGSVNNDNLATMLSSLTLLHLARLWREKFGATLVDGAVGKWAVSMPWLYLGLLLGLGFWTKLSLLVFWPLAGLVALRAATLGRRNVASVLRGTLRNGAWAFLPAASLCLPLAIRNVGAFGDPLGWGLMRKVTEAVAGPLAPADYAAWLIDLFQSFWGRFGGAAHVRMNPLVYAGLAAISVLACVGLVRFLWRMRRSGSAEDEPARPPSGGLLGLLGLLCLLVAGLLWQWANTNQGTGQARLAYPALPAIGVFFVTGLAESTARARSWVRACGPSWLLRVGWLERLGRGIGLPQAVGGGMLALSLATVFSFLLPIYHLPPRIPLGSVPASAFHGPFTFGNEIRLLGWELEKNTLTSGETCYLTLYWQAVTGPREDDWLLLRLQGQGDRTVWDKDGSPSAGRDGTDTWRAGDVIASRHRIALSDQAPPGVYRLLAGLHRFGAWDWLLIQDASGKTIGDTIALGEVMVAGR